MIPGERFPSLRHHVHPATRFALKSNDAQPDQAHVVFPLSIGFAHAAQAALHQSGEFMGPFGWVLLGHNVARRQAPGCCAVPRSFRLPIESSIHGPEPSIKWREGLIAWRPRIDIQSPC